MYTIEGNIIGIYRVFLVYCIWYWYMHYKIVLNFSFPILTLVEEGSKELFLIIFSHNLKLKI